MGDDFKKVRSGEPLRIPAATFNTILDATQDYLRRQQGIGGRPSRPTPDQSAAIILIKNGSGAAVNRFGALGIDTILFTPTQNLDGFKNQPVLTCITPAAGHAGAFVMPQEPIASGAIGRAAISGVSIARVDVADAGHLYADVAAGHADYLASGASGSAQILWKEAGTGEKWALVRLGGGAGTHTSPKALYATFEGAEAAQTDTWDRTNQGANDGVTFPWHTREAYSETGGKILYGYYRLVTIDSAGAIVSISAETRYTIDAPEAH